MKIAFDFDRWSLAASALWLAVALPYVLPIFRGAGLHFLSYYVIELALLPLTVVALIVGGRRAGRSELGSFFRRLSAAYGFWLLAALLRLPLQHFVGLDAEQLVRDSLYTFYYVSLLWALELARAGRVGGATERLLPLIGSAVLVAGSLIYLQLLPGAPTSGTYPLYAALDLYIAARLVMLMIRARGTLLQPLFLLLALGNGLLTLSDSLEAAYRFGLLEYVESSPLNGIWVLSYVPILLATRLRLPSEPELDRAFETTRARFRLFSMLWSPLIGSAFVLPAVHVLIHAAGVADPAAATIRGYFIVGWLLLGGLLIVSQHVVVARRLSASDTALETSLDRIKDLTRAREEAVERERLHLSRELHDELGQLLVALQLEIAWLRSNEAEGGPERGERLVAATKVLDDALDFSRRAATGLRPRVLDELGLSSALELLANETATRSDLDVRFTARGEQVTPSSESDTALYRIAQEGLTNCLKHAGASRVEIDVVADGSRIELTIRDDGVGVAGADRGVESAGLGLLSIRERAEALGGEMRIGTGIGGVGFSVTVSVPVGATELAS